MSEFVKKTMMGYKEVPGGYIDQEWSHVIMSRREYEQHNREISEARQEALNAKYNAEREIQRARDTAQYQIAEVEETAAKTISGLESALAAERKESALQRDLNENLLRMAKERSNVDRKLKPKKEHTGYVVLTSTEKECRYRDGNRRWYTVMLWETVMETPYSVELGLEEVRRLLDELFQADENGVRLIHKIGITVDYPDGYEELIYDKKWRENYWQYNVMLERRLKANYRAGYWEIIFMHTKPLSGVPMDMRLPPTN